MAVISKDRGGSVYSSSFRHVAVQTIAMETPQTQESTFRADVFRPPARTDFTSLDGSIRTLARPRNIDIQHHARRSPRAIHRSQHLKALKEVGLIKGIIEGPCTCYCINRETFDKMVELWNNFIASIKGAKDDNDCICII